MQKTYTLLTLCFLLLGHIAFSQALKQAIETDDTVKAEALIKAGANVNERDDEGLTPLFKACRWGYVSGAKMLLNNGASVDTPVTKTGRTAFIVACAYYSGANMIKLLVEHGANVNAKTNNGVTGLMMAAKGCKSDVVEYLLAHGADATLKDDNQHTALDYATHAQAVENPASFPNCKLDKQDCINRLTKATGK